MPHRTLEINLIDPLALTRDPTSAGRPESLDYIPGASLLGLFAGKGFSVFETSPGTSAFEAFFSGRLRFGDGLPVSHEDAIGYPSPLSLHSRKGDAGKPLQCANKLLNSDTVFDQQIRNSRISHITLAGRELRPERQSVLKTAIDSATGRARDALLFGIDALAPHQTFRAEITADDMDLLDLLPTILPDGATARLGRSRRQEFGRIRVNWLEAVDLAPPTLKGSGDVVLWALSDICLDPTLSAAEALGFAGATIDENRSFTRMRRYTPFNSTWMARGLEREVIERGSVIVLSDAAAPDRAVIHRGMFQECGLGRIAVNSELLFREMLTIDRSDRKVKAVKASAAGATPVFDFARRRLAARKTPDEARYRPLLERMLENYAALARFNGTAFRDGGPAPSQWSRIRLALLAHGPGSDVAATIDKALGDRDGDKKQKAGWDDPFGPGEGQTFRQWIIRETTDHGAPFMAGFSLLAMRRAQDIRDGRIVEEPA